MNACKLVLAASLFALTACAGAKYMIGKDQRPAIKSNPDKAVLAVVRTTSFGFGVVIDDYVDGKLVGQTRGKSSFITEVTPGTHYVMGKAENISTARMNFEAGKIYFLNQYITPGFWKARTGFAPMAYDDGLKEFNQEGCDYREYDSAHPGPDLEKSDYEEAKNDFEREVREKPDEHRDLTEYKGTARP